VRSIWFENLVADAMATEACCLLKTNLSGDNSRLNRQSSCAIMLGCFCLICCSRAHQLTSRCEQMTPSGFSSPAVCNRASPRQRCLVPASSPYRRAF
jgi:hypothetical protein